MIIRRHHRRLEKKNETKYDLKKLTEEHMEAIEMDKEYELRKLMKSDLTTLKVSELKAIAEMVGIDGYSNMIKQELIESLCG